MAETVRLLASLRQIFPNGDDSWRTAPNLVADYRIAIRERRYPKRDIPAPEFVRRVAAVHAMSPLAQAALAALTARPFEFMLSGFQERATATGLRAAGSDCASGMVVSAGTGSGKTLAFYLPALVWTADTLDNTYWARTLAIYPRVELIKDQFQAAYIECRRLDAVLASAGKRKILIGALYGDTPNTRRNAHKYPAWTRKSDRLECPLLRCPHCGSGTLSWFDTDRTKDIERLVCGSCRKTLEHDEIVLTRERMKMQTPDILFTTTEMLNKEMSNDWNQHVFGIGPRSRGKKPRFLLLDEVHVNQGTTGAQTAYLVRRWRSALRAPITIVGLSATLTDARGFFSDLVGIQETHVVEVSPREGELVAEGMEYSLALRGDPASGTALLSTTIQTIMLLRRMLDTSTRVSGGLYGTRLYAFTDQLDAVNRLYWDTANAEGWARPRVPMGRRPRSLAALRSPQRRYWEQRIPEGQSWDAAIEIGHSLDDEAQLTVSRTTSQDAGVSSTDVVTATASIEIGFDDPEAGAVVQHKAPRQAAQFIQRKGRAGRVRGMRPWTVVVLSDYGRDRAAYAAYEGLVDPQLERQVLPLTNRYVLRMQAGFALLEWLGTRLSAERAGAVWDDAASPNGDRARQRSLAALAERLMSSPQEQYELAVHLAQVLQISVDEAKALMWESPRSLMIELLPTLHRRLDTKWSTHAGEGTDRYQRMPLPEFLPENLFSDLLVPEVTIQIPMGVGRDVKLDSMGVVQALTEFAPGRASKRFAVERQSQSHWVPIAFDHLVIAQSVASPVDDWIEGEEIGTFSYTDESGEDRHVRCLRPMRVTLQPVPIGVRDTTTARPVWKTQLLRHTSPEPANLPNPSLWTTLVSSTAFHLHIQGHQVSVRRFYHRVNFDLKRSNGDKVACPVNLVSRAVGETEASEDRALGFETTVDGLRLSVEGSLLKESLKSALSPEGQRASRSEWFESQVLRDEGLPSSLNEFQRQWLAVLARTSLISRAIQDGCDLRTAHERLREEGLSVALTQILDCLVGVASMNDEADWADVDPDDQGRLYQVLHAAIGDRFVCGRIDQLLLALHSSPDANDGFHDWQLNRALGTLGAAVVEAISRIDSRLDTSILAVDLGGGPTDPGAQPNNDHDVWITELIPGGAGVLEQFARTYSRDPKRFWRIVSGVLLSTPQEDVDTGLRRVLGSSQDFPLSASLQRVRTAYTVGQETLTQAVADLRNEMAGMGIKTSHSVMSALSARVLRPGTSVRTDQALLTIIDWWDSIEEDFSIDVDVQTVAYALSLESRWDGVLCHSVEGSPLLQRQARYRALLGLLWLRGGTARASGLRINNRFGSHVAVDRLLLEPSLKDERPRVHLASPDWKEAATQALARAGEVDLEIGLDGHDQLHTCLLRLLSQPTEVGYLLLYPRLGRLQSTPSGYAATLELREAAQ
jgi:hypothetical protein